MGKRLAKQLEELGACKPACNWARRTKGTSAQLWEKAPRFAGWRVWLLTRVLPLLDSKLYAEWINRLKYPDTYDDYILEHVKLPTVQGGITRQLNKRRKENREYYE